MVRKVVGVVLATMLMATAARAEWQRAESAHYIVYGDMKSDEIRKAAEKLEKYTFVMRVLSGMRSAAPNPTKLTVYMVHDMNQVQATMPFPSSGVGGYYSAAVRGSILVTPPLGRSTPQIGVARDEASKVNYDLIAYHEVAHNFMYQNSSALYPTWYSEGFADFYGTFRLEETPTTDRVEIGQPQYWRMDAIAAGEWISADKLLSAHSYSDVGDSIDALYAEGWLLVHFAATNPERGKQLRLYLDAINAGMSYTDAAKRAFGGDLARFNSDLRAYSRNSRLNLISYPFKKIDPGKVDVRPMTGAEVALWRSDLRLSSGIAKRDASAFANDVRQRAARFGDDAYALRILTDTEMQLDNVPAATQAVTHWLAIAPRDPLALMFKGDVEVATLKAAKVPAGDPRWGEARKPILSAIRLNGREPRILRAYYNSFVAEGVLPPAGAQNGLMEALSLVPSDDDLRMQVARDFERRDQIDDAITVIKPLAYRIRPNSEMSPSERARRDREKVNFALLGEDPNEETAREMMTRLEKKRAALAPAAAPAPAPAPATASQPRTNG